MKKWLAENVNVAALKVTKEEPSSVDVKDTK